jgi:sugar (pentulose or hexulose) kinase
VKVKNRVSPNAHAAGVLKKQYEKFRQLYPALKPLFS